MDNWVMQLCRKSAKRRLSVSTVFAALAILAMVGGAAADWRYFSNVVQGPYNVSATDLERMARGSDFAHYFVRVAGAEAIDAGQESNGYGAPEGPHYYGVRMGDRFLLVKHDATSALAFQGALEPLPADRRVFLMRNPAAKRMSEFYPLYLDADGDFRLGGYLAAPVAAFLILILALSLKRGGTAWLELRDPTRHRVYKRIAAWGNPLSCGGEIENEYRTKVRMRKFGAVFTENYLIWDGSVFFGVFRFRDLLWAYKKVTTQRINFIPVGKTFGVRLIFPGEPASFSGAAQEMDDLLSFLNEKAPWAIFGYSSGLEKSYRNDPKAFSARVARRQQDWLREANAKLPVAHKT